VKKLNEEVKDLQVVALDTNDMQTSINSQEQKLANNLKRQPRHMPESKHPSL
jgi:hypothetical protein